IAVQPAVAIVARVQPDDLVALVDQHRAQQRADVAIYSGNENFHFSKPLGTVETKRKQIRVEKSISPARRPIFPKWVGVIARTPAPTGPRCTGSSLCRGHCRQS